MRNDKLITVMSPLTLPVSPGGQEPLGLWLSHLPSSEGRAASGSSLAATRAQPWSWGLSRTPVPGEAKDPAR